MHWRWKAKLIKPNPLRQELVMKSIFPKRRERMFDRWGEGYWNWYVRNKTYWRKIGNRRHYRWTDGSEYG